MQGSDEFSTEEHNGQTDNKTIFSTVNINYDDETITNVLFFPCSQFQGYASSPAAAFTLASPPSIPQQVAPSPSTAFIGTPSPGNLLVGESPGNPTLHVPSPGSFVPAPSPQSLGIHMPSPAASFISPQGKQHSYPVLNSIFFQQKA